MMKFKFEHAGNTRWIPLMAVCLFATVLSLKAQISVPFDTLHWDIRAQEFELRNYKGQDALYMKGGVAIHQEASLENGVIEWDMAFPEERGFTGVRFRMKDLRNFEEFYLRPHQSGMPDANQYCPVDNGVSSWQLYHGELYGVPYEYNFDKWFHVRLVVADTRAEVYIDNMRFPILHIPFLKRAPEEGMIAVYGSLVPVYFANFSYTPQASVQLVNSPVERASPDPLAIQNWSVSSPFSNSLLTDVHDLQQFAGDQLTWQPLKAEASGTANIATITDFDSEKRNTVFARIIVISERDQTRQLQFGYSDRATVFLNGRAVFQGDDSYATRDYRFLGTIGYFDSVFVPLKRGENEIVIAVTESFGGWGIKARWTDMDGIRHQDPN